MTGTTVVTVVVPEGAEAQVVALAERLRRERVVSKLEPEPPEA